MFQRITDYIIGALLIGVVLFFLWGKFQGNRVEDALTENRQYAGNARAHETAAAELRIIYEEKEKANARLEEALERNAEWADGHMPSDVADELRHPTNAARAVP